MAEKMTASLSARDVAYFPYPYSLSPLPEIFKKGLIAPGTVGTVSAVSCFLMLTYVLHKFLTWRHHFKTFIGYNQYIVLIVNLLLADMLQGISFTISFHWIAVDGILAPTTQCFAQGFLLNAGDLASGFFVFGIALHTFYGAVQGRHAKHSTFIALVVFAWVLALLLSSLGPIMHRNKYYVRAGAWCWASSVYESDRLALHYVWIFFVQFGIIVLYFLIFAHLKRTISNILPTTDSPTHAKVDRAAKMMAYFPIAYIVLTLPLSAGRMWSTAHGGANLPDSYSLVAGSLLASCGWVDCLLYTLTRRALLKQNKRGTRSGTGSYGINEGSATRESWGMSKLSAAVQGITQTRTVTVSNGAGHGKSVSSATSTTMQEDMAMMVGGSADRSVRGGSDGSRGTGTGGGGRDMYAHFGGYSSSSLEESPERTSTPRAGETDSKKVGRDVEVSAESVENSSFEDSPGRIAVHDFEESPAPHDGEKPS